MNGYEIKQKNKRSKQNKYFKAEAQKQLLSSDNLYKSILSHFIGFLVCGGFFYAAIALSDMAGAAGIGDMREEAAKILIYTVCAILCLVGSFFLFAFSLGAYKLSCDMGSAGGGDGLSSLSGILDPIANKKSFKNTLSLFIIVLFEMLLCWAPSVTVIILSVSLGGVLQFLVNTAAVLCSIFLSTFFLILLMPYPYVQRDEPDSSAFKLYKKSARAALCDVWLGYYMTFSFLWLILLSVLSFGVLFFAYTMPYMTLSMSRAGEYIYNIAITERKDTINAET